MLAGLVSWLFEMLAAGRLTYRRTALGLSLALLVLLVLAQVAIGNRAPRDLGPGVAGRGSRGARRSPRATVPGRQRGARADVESLLLFLTYAGAYVLVVNGIRGRRALSRLVRTLLLTGGILAFLGLADYFAGRPWLLWWQGDERLGRLSGTFDNPDHFGSWLVMLVCLGIGYLRSRAFGRGAPALGDLLHWRQAREEAIRRYLPFAAAGVMTLALVFTLSRGALLSLGVTLVALLLLFGRLGQLRWSLALAGALTVVTLAYGAWIGLDPLLARADVRDEGRWLQWLSTMPMVKDFALLGVGLGAYKEIYYRYQPLGLDPANYTFPYAHNDLLQAVVELGVPGAVLLAWAVWRVGRDLVGAHLLGEARCPVAVGSGRHARRHNPFNVGIAVGGLAAVFALLVHSAVDFAARIPANGLLAAACLGIATSALHSRFGRSGEAGLAATREWPVPERGRLRLALASVALAAALGLAVLALRPAVVEARIDALEGPRGLAIMKRVLEVDRWNVRALRASANLRAGRATELLDEDPPGTKRTAAERDERRRQALALLEPAIAEWRRALALSPSRPTIHRGLAWGYQAAATADASRAVEYRQAAFAHLQRAIVLAPEDPSAYKSLADLAASPPNPRPDMAVAAAAAAVSRDPARLPDLIDSLLPLDLADVQWDRVVPKLTLDRLRLATALEGRGRRREAERMYRLAREVASGEDEPLARWLLARFLSAKGEAGQALAELAPALQREPDNPELRLARAEARAKIEDPGALEDHRAALAGALARDRDRVGRVTAFATTEPKARALIAERLGKDGVVPVLRYRRALAQHLSDRRLWAPALEAWDAVVAEAPQDAARSVRPRSRARGPGPARARHRGLPPRSGPGWPPRLPPAPGADALGRRPVRAGRRAMARGDRRGAEERRGAHGPWRRAYQDGGSGRRLPRVPARARTGARSSGGAAGLGAHGDAVAG